MRIGTAGIYLGQRFIDEKQACGGPDEALGFSGRLYGMARRQPAAFACREIGLRGKVGPSGSSGRDGQPSARGHGDFETVPRLNKVTKIRGAWMVAVEACRIPTRLVQPPFPGAAFQAAEGVHLQTDRK